MSLRKIIEQKEFKSDNNVVKVKFAEIAKGRKEMEKKKTENKSKVRSCKAQVS